MSDADAVEPTEIARRLDEQWAALARVRAEVGELRRGLSTEVRTRRVAVVEDDGFERVVVVAEGRWGLVAVHARSGGPPTCVELVANDAADGQPASIAAALTDRGDVVGTLELVEGRPPALFLHDGPELP